MTDGSDERKKGEKLSKYSIRKSEEEEPEGSFEARRVPVPGPAVVVSAVGGPLVLSLAGELSLAGDFSLTGKFSLAGERSLAGESSLGGVVEADGISGAASGHSW